MSKLLIKELFYELLGIIVEVYVDDMVIKLAGLGSHLADFHLALGKMRPYGRKMNILKCALVYQLVKSWFSLFMNMA
jgi:hypothetical protein